MVIYLEDFLARRCVAVRAPRLVAAAGGGSRPVHRALPLTGMARPADIDPVCTAPEQPPLDLAKLYEEASLI